MPTTLPPHSFGKYHILKEIAKGGMGTVYLAQDPEIKIYVALKVLHPSSSQTRRSRFLREAQLASRLNHPNIVRILDFGIHQSKEYLVMEYIQGTDLEKYLQIHGPLPPQSALPLVCQLAKAVHYAHQNNILHRDLKTANVLLSSKGNPIIIDFGIAKELHDCHNTLTRAGSAVGSPSFMAPEQIRGEPLDKTVDVYALGVILFNLLTGLLPYHAATSAFTYTLVLNNPIPSLREFQPNLSQTLDAICQKAMAKSSQDRFQTALELAQTLEHCLQTNSYLQQKKSTSLRKTKSSSSKKTALQNLPNHHSSHTLKKTIALKKSPSKKNNKLLLTLIASMSLAIATLSYIYLQKMSTSSKNNPPTPKQNPSQISQKSLPQKQIQSPPHQTNSQLPTKTKNKNYKPSTFTLIHSENTSPQTHPTSSTQQEEQKTFQLKDALALIRKKIKEKLYPEAIQYASQALNQFPNNPSLLVERAYAHYHLQNYTNALYDLQQAAQLRPNHAFTYELMGKIYYLTKEDKKALKCYNKAFQLGMKCHSCLGRRGNLLILTQKYKEAVHNAKYLLNQNNNCPLAFFQLGLCAYLLKKNKRAIQYFLKFIQLCQKKSKCNKKIWHTKLQYYYDAHYYLGKIYLEQQKTKKAQYHFSQFQLIHHCPIHQQMYKFKQTILKKLP
ncbi:MAG: serine/threonine protein kinase [Planctomycetota bacterium]|nr:MAG: serine/threonine protein kinase [Planctomycetota bacterium]